MSNDENVVKAISEQFFADLDKMRSQLMEAMSGYSEALTCASWISDLDRRLHKEAGIWEAIARKTGWPVYVGGSGNDMTFRWLTWEEAGEVYKHPSEEQPHWVVEVEAHGLNAEGSLKDCGA